MLPALPHSLGLKLPEKKTKNLLLLCYLCLSRHACMVFLVLMYSWTQYHKHMIYYQFAFELIFALLNLLEFVSKNADFGVHKKLHGQMSGWNKTKEQKNFLLPLKLLKQKCSCWDLRDSFSYPKSIEWFIEGQAFWRSKMIRFLAHPLSPLSRQQFVFPSQSSCVLLVELTERRGGGRGAKSYDRQEGRALHKSFDTLCSNPK